MSDQNHQLPFASRPSVARCWWMWVIAALFYCYESFLQISPNVMNDDLRMAFHLSAEQMGHLGAWYFYAYALMQIPVGLLIDRYGVKPLLGSSVLVCALGSLVFGFAHTFGQACIGRFLIGFGSSFAVVSCMQIAAVWLPPKRFALLTGATLMLGMLGAAGAQVPLHALLSLIGWRHTMFLFAALGLLLMFVVMLVLVDKPKVVSVADEHGTFDHGAVSWWSGMKETLMAWRIWLVSIYAALMFVSTPVFGGLWGASFLIGTLQISEAKAAYMIQYLFIGWAVGAPLFGWFSDRIQRRLPPMYIGSLGTLIVLLMVLYLHALPLLVYPFLLFAMGFFTSGFLPSFSIIRDISVPHCRATNLGFANTMNMMGPALANPLVGWLLDKHWDGRLVGHVRIYNAHDYHLAVMVLPICVALSVLLLPWIKESHGQPYEVVSQ
jgi:MFS family permease